MRTALVTGASRGIGRAIALDLAGSGFGVTVTSRSEADLLELTSVLAAAGSPRVSYCAAELADTDALEAVVERHAASFGGMDALILCGGVGTAGPLESVAAHRIDKTIAVNLRSSIALVQAALPLLRKTGGGSPHGARIIMMSSITGVYAEPGLAVYGATKAALLSLAETVNAEESRHGVMATAIAPGYAATDMSAWTHDKIGVDTMIPVSDIVSVTRMLLGLGRNTSITRLVLSRSGTRGFEA